MAAASEASDSSSFGVDTAFSAAVATVVRAQTKDFVVVRREWAAIRIQTMFRAFLVTFSFFLFYFIFDVLSESCSVLCVFFYGSISFCAVHDLAMAFLSFGLCLALRFFFEQFVLSGPNNQGEGLDQQKQPTYHYKEIQIQNQKPTSE